MKVILTLIAGLVFFQTQGQIVIDLPSLTLAGGEQESNMISISLAEIALIDIESETADINIDFNFGSTQEAGIVSNGETSITNNSLWLNYTSAVALGQTRNISVALSQELPSGINLSLVLDSYTGNGQGQFGIPAPALSLNSISQNVLTNIGGAYTGNGNSNGHKLNYQLNINNFSNVSNENFVATVVYTISPAF